MPGQLVKRPELTTKAVPSWWVVVTVRCTVMECDMMAGHRSPEGRQKVKGQHFSRWSQGTGHSHSTEVT